MCAVSTQFVPYVLRAYAELSTTPGGSSGPAIAPLNELAVVTATGSVDGSYSLVGQPVSPVPDRVLGRPVELAVETLPLHGVANLDRLAKLDTLHTDEVLLRHSWVLVVGTIDVDGAPRQVLQPLLSRPVRLRRHSPAQRAAFGGGGNAGYRMSYLGDAEMNPRIDDPDLRAALLERATFGKGSLRSSTNEALLARMPTLDGWVRDSARAVGFPVDRVLPASEHPAEWIARRGLVAIVTHSIHSVRQVNVASLRTTLLAWANRKHVADTALGALLEPPAADPVRSTTTTAPLDSPMLLSPSQRDVVARARTQPLTVVSGAPGSGKTHTLCAVALDSIARGDSVLIATQSRHAADVVAEMLDRTPGPTPVRFGDGAGMAALIDELNERITHPVDDSQVRTAERDLDLARVERDALRDSVVETLRIESEAEAAPRWRAALPMLMAAAPRVFALDSDLDALDAQLGTVRSSAARATDSGWFARWRARAARRRLDAATGSAPSTDLIRIENALAAARAGRAAATSVAQGGTDLGDRWKELQHAEDRCRDALGRRLALGPLEAGTRDAASRAALGELTSALRSGRGRRRERLATMRPRHLTDAAPLWVGTLADVEDVLPATPRLFDVVILDEASQVEQPRAAPALLRGARGVVVGDPHQLRHVSFRSDAEIDDTLERFGLVPWRAQLDLRRISTFDLAAMSAPVDQLREHFRSVPHLIDFSVERFYRDRVRVMTRHPRNESLDAIDVVAAAPPEPGAKVHGDEIRAVMELLEGFLRDGVRGIEVLSPFRDQADALEAAIIEHCSATDIERLELRVGTVHSFQGGERNVVIASLALSPSDPPGRRRFLENPNLFNVMVTRARERMIVVTSLPIDTTGLTGDYLRYAAHPLAPWSEAPADEESGSWRDELAHELGRYGTVRIDYPVGQWHLDLCVGQGGSTRLIECAVSADGVEAHVDRRLALMRLGWDVVDGFPSRWDGNPARAALDLR